MIKTHLRIIKTSLLLAIIKKGSVLYLCSYKALADKAKG